MKQLVEILIKRLCDADYYTLHPFLRKMVTIQQLERWYNLLIK